MDPTTLETIGEEDLGGTLNLKVLGAHFRYDPFLDRLVTLSLKAGVNREPSLAINEYGREWAVKSLQVNVTVGKGGFFFIFMTLPTIFCILTVE